MSHTAAVTHRGASLLEADPGLARLLRARDVAEFGHRRLLPVLTLSPGAWSPPPADALGEATVALAVLGGVLLRRSPERAARLLGPGDLAEPWMSPRTSWCACTPVRAAVIGEEFLQAVAPWPQAAAHLLRRTGGDAGGLSVARSGGAAAAEDRLAELLWRLAARWGRPEGDGIVLPLQLTPVTLAVLSDVAEADAVRSLRALEQADRVILRADGTWLLRPAGVRPGGGLAALRDDLRERVAAGLAEARATQALWAALIEEAAAHVRRGQARRGRD
jgi:hypothetical protein